MIDSDHSVPQNPTEPKSAVDVYGIPPGAGSPVVQLSGIVFETLSARRQSLSSQGFKGAPLRSR